MAALCTTPSFYTSYCLRITRQVRSHRPLSLLSCQRKSQEEKQVKKKHKGVWETLSRMIGKARPQKKGDVKDLVLMSLSFALYIYISQQIVCAYFAWLSIPTSSW